MNTAIQSLMDDHRYIERMLSSLDAYAAAGPELAKRDALTGYADFIREFVDKCHHGKEEDRLFKQMAANGFPTHAGPVAVMLQEHQMGRMWAGEIGRLSTGGDWTSGDWGNLKRSAGELSLLMREHINKEDEVLYPMAMRMLPPELFEMLAKEFTDFENSLPRGGLEKWKPLGEQLCAAYPPVVTKAGLPVKHGGCGTGCGHHDARESVRHLGK